MKRLIGCLLAAVGLGACGGGSGGGTPIFGTLEVCNGTEFGIDTFDVIVADGIASWIDAYHVAPLALGECASAGDFLADPIYYYRVEFFWSDGYPPTSIPVDIDAGQANTYTINAR